MNLPHAFLRVAYVSLFTVLFCYSQTYGQCDAIETNVCELAPATCLVGKCFVTHELYVMEHNNWCGPMTIVNNPQYFPVLAQDTVISFGLQLKTCFGGQSYLQLALLDACDWTNANVIDCYNIQPLDHYEFAFSGLQSGSMYWIIVDGGAGSLCEYEFTDVQGTEEPSPTYLTMLACNGNVEYNGATYELGTHEIAFENPIPGGCDSIVFLTVTPQCDVSLNPVDICSDGEIVEVAPVISGIGGPYAYLWNDNTTDSVATMSLNQGDLIVVTVTDSEGCTGEAAIEVGSTLKARILPENAYICDDGSLSEEVQVSITSGQPPYTYSWLAPGDSMATAEFALAGVGTYMVTVVDADDCIRVMSYEIDVVKPLVAAFDYEINGNVVHFFNLSENATSYSWHFGYYIGSNEITSGMVNPSHRYPKTGTYDVKLIAYGPCGSDSIVIPVHAQGVAINEVGDAPEQLRIFPNPNNGLFTITLPDHSSYTLEVFNLVGERIWQGTLVDAQSGSEILLKNADPGIYFVVASKPGQRHVGKVVLQ